MRRFISNSKPNLILHPRLTPSPSLQPLYFHHPILAFPVTTLHQLRHWKPNETGIIELVCLPTFPSLRCPPTRSLRLRRWHILMCTWTCLRISWWLQGLLPHLIIIEEKASKCFCGKQKTASIVHTTWMFIWLVPMHYLFPDCWSDQRESPSPRGGNGEDLELLSGFRPNVDTKLMTKASAEDAHESWHLGECWPDESHPFLSHSVF